MSTRAELIKTELLPKLLQEFVRLIGLRATLDLVHAYGGLRIYVPSPERCHAEHPFAKIIGLDNLLALAKVYGQEDHFTLPKATAALLAVRNARICDAYANHKTARELAAEHRLNERQIERIVAAAGVVAPVDRRQATLF
ncbi:Mor transcription activator family protein [Ottowia oryzae]